MTGINKLGVSVMDIPKEKDFPIETKVFEELNTLYSNMRNNGDISKRAVHIAKMYLSSINNNIAFDDTNRKGVDLTVILNGHKLEFEIKGTCSEKLNVRNIKISGKPSYDAVNGGMPIICITKLKEKIVKIHLLKVGIDFLIEPEPRWTLIKPK